jgi:rhodanese-related sulfurtransferase
MFNIFRKSGPTVPVGESEPFDPRQLEVTSEQLRDTLGRGEPVVLLDVREPIEVRTCALPGMTWIPMGELTGRLSEIDRNATVVAYCHVGGRSKRVAAFLRSQGIPLAWSLAGGIDRWARVIDPTVPRY